MNQFIGQRRFAQLKNGAGIEEHMRRIAPLLRPDGWARLGADHKAMRLLRRSLLQFQDMRFSFVAQDDAFLKFSGESGSIESLLAKAEGLRLPALPSCGGDVRIKIIAAEILSGGEVRLDRSYLMRALKAFQASSALNIRELICFPDAMAAALMEETAKCCGEVIKSANERRLAQVWVRCGGKGRLKGNEGAVYTAQALKCAEEAEDADLHRRMLENITANGQNPYAMEAESRHVSARQLLCAENLLSAWQLLRKINWKECYEALSFVEAEMNADPGSVYGNMDEESKTQMRDLVSAAAKQLGLEEYMIVNAALSEANSCVKKFGLDDPRATICYYLYENDGRRILSQRLNAGRKLRRTLPDPFGRVTAACLCVFTLIFALLFGYFAGDMLLSMLLLPLAWMFAMQLAAKFYPMLVKPRRLLKMKAEFAQKNARTLVVMPALLSGEGRVQEMIERMETAGCLETGENIDFLLLGDFRDSNTETEDGDRDILISASEGVKNLNNKYGRQKFFYLHRGRKYREQDEKWMGENRKRGAVRALNALILGKDNAAAEFSAENECAEHIAHAGYRYVVTLDADTVYVPGTVQRLVGTMMHPLNKCCCIDGVRRGYAVLQPAMQLKMHARDNAYAALVNMPGGMDSYPCTMSDFYQDICGCGSFSGKGIYDVQAYYEICEGVLREDQTLSHDMVEGIICGSGRVNDIFFYESCPESLPAELGRAHRWMRGDWQNAYLIFSRKKMRALDRLRILGNLLNSLYAPCLLALLLISAWMGNASGFALGVVLAFSNAILNPFAEKAWKRAVFKLAILPADAKCALDAIVRTLWRSMVSKKHLMEWTVAADASNSGNTALWGRIAALMLLPALIHPGWIIQTAALAALFAVSGGWAEDLKQAKMQKQASFTAGQVCALGETALATWRFFEEFVQEDGNGLPPDNVQLDPPVGVANRTSPTNIGLYLMSCLAAYELGFIRMENALRRIKNCVSTIERMGKWRGHIFNWHDSANLEPLRPRYVSSVDSGNLAAALMLVAHGFEEADADIARRMMKIARDMDFAALYDEEHELFRIGIDVENNAPSHAHYDLYASEARILSYAAMMLGQVPPKHWQRLNRMSVDIGNKNALVSWSGTMFEYLMPEIFMRSHAASLAGQTAGNVVDAQVDFARRCMRPWGISESGYYAFDMHLNYQYRAFGLQSLALCANAAQDVVAPYASFLALCVRPGEAAENIMRMQEMLWQGEYGFYEAADYLKTSKNGAPRLVKSHMAHHQGMILCAICNALRDNVLSECFMDIPQAKALKPLLEERAADGAVRLKRQKLPVQDVRTREERTARTASRDKYSADTHLLCGGGTTALVSADGAVYAWHKGVQLNRFSGDLTGKKEGMYVHLSSKDTGESIVLGAGGRFVFEAGRAEAQDSISGIASKMQICVSPENGALVYAITLKNIAETAREVQLAACFAVALAPQGDMRAHPAFQNLFIECRREGENVLRFARRPREKGKVYPQLLFAGFGGENISVENDMERLVGRNGAMGASGGISECFEGIVSHAINPCGAIRMNVLIAPGEEKQMYFALAAVEEHALAKTLRMLGNAQMPQRSLQLSSTLARTSLHASGINAAHYRLLQRGSALLFDAHLQPELNTRFEACMPAPRELIWRAGISGDLPIILADIRDDAQMKTLRDIMRIHAFYRDMGVWTDIVLINSHGNDYRQPVSDAIADMVACSHLAGLMNQSGGVHIIDRANADERVVSAVERIAAMRFCGNTDAFAQLDRMLDVLNVQNGENYLPMTGAVSTDEEKLKFDNAYGGFGGGGYRIRLAGGMLPPAPWSNIMAEGESGAVVTEHCGGFAWSGNSRSARLTGFANDTLSEGWGWMFYIFDHAQKRFMRILPGDKPMADFSVCHKPGISTFASGTGQLRFETRVRAMEGGIEFEIEIENTSQRTVEFSLAGFVDWLMGVDENDRRMLRTWNRMGACFASGSANGTGFFACDDPKAHAGASRREFFSGGDIMHPRGMQSSAHAGGWVIDVPLCLKAREKAVKRFILGAEKDAAAAYERVRRISEIRSHADENFMRDMQKMKFDTPNEALNLLANGFLQNQALNCRILAKTGLYQPGGAYGFRDQLQDMLLMIHYKPHLVRNFLLKCASRQFEAGDVLHWWHEPMNGVRTRISDDKLFLPYVTAEYVRITGDEDILSDNAAFLKDIEIPEGREDVYAPMQPSEITATLHEHCMRALRSAEKTGKHGLCLMGSGDWNDGMNRVGAEGMGESVWLSMFLAVCAKKYAAITKDEGERAYLLAMNERLCAAVEEYAWDGRWYLRAYADDGRKLGGRESGCCKIDLISQAWSVFAGLDGKRAKSAMDAAWEQLVDHENGAIRLLTPPFDGKDFDPGYIASYPAGIRENGAQYTHAACWYGIALAEMGDAERAHEVLDMLLPVNHAKDREGADIYRVEPYVMAADIYTNADYAGRGGWTWYTGSAQWMMQFILSVFGYERSQNRVRIRPLMGKWKRAAISIRYGSSEYVLTADTAVEKIMLDGREIQDSHITMQDDGLTHHALFPPRKTKEEAKTEAVTEHSLKI